MQTVKTALENKTRRQQVNICSFYKIQRHSGTCRLTVRMSEPLCALFIVHLIITNRQTWASLHSPSKHYLTAVTIDTSDNIRPESVTTGGFNTFTAEIFAPSRPYLHVLVAAPCNFQSGQAWTLTAACRNPWHGWSPFWSNLLLQQSEDQSGPAGLTKRATALGFGKQIVVLLTKNS